MSTKVIKEGNVTTEITDMTGGVGGSLSADELMAKMGGQGERKHNIMLLLDPLPQRNFLGVLCSKCNFSCLLLNFTVSTGHLCPPPLIS